VQHAVDLLGQLVQAPRVEAEAGVFDVPGHRGHAAGMGIRVAKRCGQHRAQALVGLGVAAGADEREDVPLAALQEASQDLHAHESRRAGDQDRLLLRLRIGLPKGVHSATVPLPAAALIPPQLASRYQDVGG
jgi:hypothetical protein